MESPEALCMPITSDTNGLCKNTHSCILMNELWYQCQSGKFCDMEFHVDSQIISAHRCVIAGNSLYFLSILDNSDTRNENFDVLNVDKSVFQTLICYIYTNRIDIDQNNVFLLMQLASHFLIPLLLNLCSEFLIGYLDPSNCLKLLKIAERYKLLGLEKNANLYIDGHINDVLQQSEIPNLRFEELRTLLMKRRQFITQPTLLDFIAKWVGLDVYNRRNNFKTLLSFIEWNSVEQMFVENHVKSSALYKLNPVCKDIIFSCLKENNIEFIANEGSMESVNSGHYLTGANSLTECVNSGNQFPDFNKKLNSWLKMNVVQIIARPRKSSTPFAGNETNDEYLASSGTQSVAIQTNSLEVPLLEITENSSAEHSSLVRREAGATNGKMDLQKYTDDIYHQSKFMKDAKCPQCPFFGKNLEHIESHLSNVHGKTCKYKCCICGFLCQRNRVYYCHMRSHFNGPPFLCDSCHRSYSSVKYLLSHRIKHFLDEDSVCFVDTGSSAPKKPKLHSPPLFEKRYPCPQCNKVCFTMLNLQFHMSSHVETSVYSCAKCDFKTEYRSRLRLHEEVHKESVFRCQFSSCDFYTSNNKELEDHFKTHTSASRRETFTERNLYVQHTRHLTGGKQLEHVRYKYSASQCNQAKFTSFRSKNTIVDCSNAANLKTIWKPNPTTSTHGTAQQYFSLVPPASILVPELNDDPREKERLSIFDFPTDVGCYVNI